MDSDQRIAYALLALADWEPEHPGQSKPELVTWFAGEPEDGLSGFHTGAHRDSFISGGSGPFLRRVTGNTFRQMPMRALRLNDEEES